MMEGLGDVIHVIGKSLVVGAQIFDGDDSTLKVLMVRPWLVLLFLDNELD
jgi:hypothetical protein